MISTATQIEWFEFDAILSFGAAETFDLRIPERDDKHWLTVSILSFHRLTNKRRTVREWKRKKEAKTMRRIHFASTNCFKQSFRDKQEVTCLITC